MVLDLRKQLANGELAALPGLTRISVGVSWDPGDGGSKGLLGKLKRKRGQDLDLIAGVLDSTGACIRMCGPTNLNVFSGALTHSGDSTTGLGDGIDEEITVDLVGMRRDVEGLVFAVTAMKPGSSFTAAKNIDVELFDRSRDREQLDIFSPPVNTQNNVILFCILDRDDANRDLWQIRRVMQPITATPETLVSKITAAFT